MTATIKRGDDKRGIVATLTKIENKIETPVNLTGHNVYFRMQDNPGLHPVTVLNAAQGQVALAFNSTMVSKAGTFKLEVVVVYNDGKSETFPHNDYITLTILEQASGGGA